MGPGWRKQLPPYLVNYVQHLDRWNRSINLISRQGTDQLLEDLFRQCRGGFGSLWSWLGEMGWSGAEVSRPVFYFDLGSGGGIPGVIWHHELCQSGANPETYLVEPRDKRAWFLERIPSDPALAGLNVRRSRWGDTRLVTNNPAPNNPAPIYIVSLKALHLTDPQVLAGLEAAFPQDLRGSLAIARFYPWEQELDSELREHLEISPQGQPVKNGGRSWTCCASEVLKWTSAGPREASLVVTAYQAAD